jgi:hypothetical protein
MITVIVYPLTNVFHSVNQHRFLPACKIQVNHVISQKWYYESQMGVFRSANKVAHDPQLRFKNIHFEFHSNHLKSNSKRCVFQCFYLCVDYFYYHTFYT